MNQNEIFVPTDDTSQTQLNKREYFEENALTRLRQDTAQQVVEEQFVANPPEKPLPRAIEEARTPEEEGERGMITDTFVQAIGGIRDATQNVLNGLHNMTVWFAENDARFVQSEDVMKALNLPGKPPEFPKESFIQLPEVDEPHTIVGGLTRGVTQFLTGFLPLTKVFGVGTSASVISNVMRGTAASTLTDFSVFDPHAERLSNFVEEFPILRNPVTKFLAADENDSEVEGRLKNVLEGFGLDVLTAGAFVGAAKILRVAKKARMARSAARRALQETGEEGAEKVIKAGAEEGLEKLTKEAPTDLFGAEKSDLAKVGKVKREIPEVPEELGLQFDITGETGEKAVNINLAKVETSDDIKKVLEITGETFKEDIKRATRGTRTNQVTEALADDLNLSVEQLLNRRKGQALNAEEAVAARKLMVSSAENIRNLAMKLVAADATDVDRIVFRKALAVHAAIQKQVSGLTAEAGRALQSFKIMAKSKAEQVDAIRAVLDRVGRGTTDDLAQAIVEAADPRKIGQIVDKAFHANSFDMVLEFWLNSILSGPRTHMVNTMSNLFNAILQVPERAGASFIGKILGSTNGVKGGEVVAQLMGFFKGAEDGWRMMKHAFKTEGLTDPLTKMEVFDRRAITSENISRTFLGKTANKILKVLNRKTLEEGGLAARFVDGVGSAIRFPGFRMLNTEDAFFKGLNYRMELNAQAYRQAAAEGLEGQALFKRMAEIIADPPGSIRQNALRMASVNTFTNPNKFAHNINQFVNKYKIFRFVAPFINTPTNIIKYGVDRSPFALLSSSVRADILAGGAKRDLALSRIALGTFAMVSAWKLAQEGRVTGGAPTDPALRKMWLTQNQEYSFVFENEDGSKEFVSYNRLEPIGMLFGFSADYANIAADLGTKEADELVSAAILAFGRNVTSKTWLQGISDILDAYTDPDRSMNKFMLNLTSGFIPNAINQVNQSFVDPVLRDARGFQEGNFAARSLAAVIDNAKKRIPGYSQELPAQRNLWGEPIEPRAGFNDGTVNSVINLLSPAYRKKVEDDAVNNFIIDREIKIEMPRRKINVPGVNEGIELSAEQYNRYVELAGEPAKKRLDQIIDTKRFRTQTPEAQEEIIKATIKAFRIRARAKLIQEYPGLVDRARERQAQLAELKAKRGVL